MKPLPTEFVKRMKSLLGEEGFARYERALVLPQPRALRVNTDKLSCEEFEKAVDFRVEKIPYAESGYYFECDKIGNHPFHHAGMIYAQEGAAMMPAECLEIQPDWRILDLCAAPGGKSTQLKNKLGERGLLVSNEIDHSRCRILAGNIERLGLKNTVVTCNTPDAVARALPESFDMIMVDAPCSGEGMFRKEEVAITEWSVGNVLHCAERQSMILECAHRALKKGGYIVYSTCTFSLEENEMTVDAFISRHPEYEILPVRAEVAAHSEDGIVFDGCGCDRMHLTRRFYPHTGRGEGQFMALLRNTDEAPDQPTAPVRDEKRSRKKGGSDKASDKVKKPDLTTVIDFLRDTLVSFDEGALKMRGDIPCLLDAELDTSGLTAISVGVAVGEVKRNYILPYHSLFMAYGKDFKRRIDLSPDSEELKKFLHGEEFMTDSENGWTAVTVCGCPVGGVKVVGGVAKNHYPKGLRTLG